MHRAVRRGRHGRPHQGHDDHLLARLERAERGAGRRVPGRRLREGAPQHPCARRRRHDRRQDQPGAARRRRPGPRRGLLVHHQQRGQVLFLGRARRSGPLPEEGRHRPGHDLPRGDERVHPVRREPVHRAAARRRVRAVLQQDGVPEGRHSPAAQDLERVRDRRREADDSGRGLVQAARFHAGLPRLGDHHRALSRAVLPDVLRREGEVTGGRRPRLPGGVRVAEAARGRTRRIPEAGAVPVHPRRRVGSQAPLPHRPGGHAAGRRVAARHGRGGQAGLRDRRRPAARTGRPGGPVRQGVHHRHRHGHRRHQPPAERGLGVRQVHHHGHGRRGRLRQRHPQRALHPRRPQVAEADVRTGLQDLPGHRREPALHHHPAVRQRRPVPGDHPAAGVRLRERQGPGSARRAEEGGRADRHRHRAGGVADDRGHPRRQAPPRGAAHARLPVALADRLRAVLRVPAGLDALLLLHALRRLPAAGLERREELGLRLHPLPAVLARPAQHPVAGRGDGESARAVRAGHRTADHEDQDGCRDLPHPVLPALPGPAGRGHHGLRLPPQPRYRAGRFDPGEDRGTGPGLVRRPHVVQAGADPAGAVGHRRPHGDLHGRAARRAGRAVRGGRAGRRLRVAALPVRHPAEHLPHRDVRRGHRGHPDHAVLHAAADRGEGRLRGDPGRRHPVRARLPGQVHAHPAPARLQPRFPALRLRLRVCRRPRPLRPVDGVHRTPDAAPGRSDPGR
ncbi:hypothetical protein SGPA1_30390 [Streptomyces misionensis JCM 4497]